MRKLTLGGLRGLSRDLPEGWVGAPTWFQRPHCPQENTYPNTALTSKPMSSAHSAWLCPAPSLPPRPCRAGCLDRQETGSQEWGCHPPRLAHEPSALVARWAPEQPPPQVLALWAPLPTGSLLQGGNDQPSWGLRHRNTLSESSCLIPTHPAKGFGLHDKVNSCPNIIRSDLFSVFRLANTNWPISHPSVPTKMLVSLTQS